MAKQDQNWNKALLEELECPVCTVHMSPPIRQCVTGHNICCKCIQKLEKCPICQGKFTESRNLSLEGIANKVTYPCVNQHLGCTANFPYRERDLHELSCPKNGYSCAMDRCSWVGKLEDLLSHWNAKKNCSKSYGRTRICHVKMNKAESFFVNIVNAHDNLFWFKSKLSKKKLFVAVQLIGNPLEAEKYWYEIELVKPGRPFRKILIADYCQSINLKDSKLFDGETCLSLNIDSKSVQNFITEDQLLIYELRVNKVIIKNPDGPGVKPCVLTDYEGEDNSKSCSASAQKSAKKN